MSSGIDDELIETIAVAVRIDEDFDAIVVPEIGVAVGGVRLDSGRIGFHSFDQEVERVVVVYRLEAGFLRRFSGCLVDQSKTAVPWNVAPAPTCVRAVNDRG